MASDSKTFTFDEVAKHNNAKDCWIIINGKVYDVTPFLDDHPGGDEALVTATAKDATIDFEDIGHSDSAIEDMKKYYVGDVDINTLPANVEKSKTPLIREVGASSNNESSGFVVKILQFVLPLLILGFAFALQYYGKSSKPNDS
ncbi:putative cytochrome b5-like heme/steroid binding domain-containing protein [Lupinus albus]|uniref:Putative cytochrome b5-like heme/steroid binding domain-containing protein n=1 Tax=Lupinus albus TaxID=3870 RepID=A0A6A4NZV9_LUPAL|nr:putative cytochrome b5-like heme/steroid binding domain-containing protein [Lupinus albus]